MKEEKSYKTFSHGTGEKSLSNNIVLSFYEDKTGTLWIGTLDGL
ncbi:MAG: hypothetical protein HYX60_01600, partial [Legionella longbeachae]|nr:hypothetical protein [Legionella longbeachae]